MKLCGSTSRKAYGYWLKIKGICPYFFLLIFLWHAAFAKPADLIRISGKLIGLEHGHLILETQSGTAYNAIIKQDIIALNQGHGFPLPWLLPGDGISAIVNPHGKAVLLESDIQWIAGTVAFASPDRLTLLEGQQFFLTGAPVYLNGLPIDPAKLDSPEQVLIRFDRMNFRVVGVWAYKPSEVKPTGISQCHISLVRASKGNFLWIQVFAEPSQKLTVQVPGVTRNYLLVENKPGVYHTRIPVPMGISVSQSHLMLQSNTEIWIDPALLSLITSSPEVTEVGPPDGAAVPINPPFIFVGFDKTQPAISSKTTQLFVDRKSVTGVSYIDDYSIFYAPPPLAPGKHECYVTGENFHQAWSFYVKP